MTDQPHDEIDDLIARWDESRIAGHELSPEELCRDRPDLLEKLRAEIATLRRVTPFEPTALGGGRRSGGGLPNDGFTHSRYRLVKMLGQGTEAEVWLARQDDLNRDVALKLPRLGGDDLLQEARTLASLQHQHILKVLEVGRDERGRLFVVTELMPGSTLAQRIGSSPKGRIAPGQAIVWTAQIASALNEIHARNIVHRDVKPINVLLDSQDKAVLADFGIAIDVVAQQEGSSAGSLGYKSPEQLRGEKLDRRSDVFSLGLVAHEMLCGHLPHSNLDDIAAIRRDVEQGLDRRVSPAIPRRLRPVIRKALSPSPRHRHDTAAKFAEELERAWQRSSVGRWLVAATVVMIIVAGWRLRQQSLATARTIDSQTQMARENLEKGMKIFEESRRKVDDVQDLSRRIIEQTMNDPFHRARKAENEARARAEDPDER